MVIGWSKEHGWHGVPQKRKVMLVENEPNRTVKARAEITKNTISINLARWFCKGCAGYKQSEFFPGRCMKMGCSTMKPLCLALGEKFPEKEFKKRSHAEHKKNMKTHVPLEPDPKEFRV